MFYYILFSSVFCYPFYVILYALILSVLMSFYSPMGVLAAKTCVEKIIMGCYKFDKN